MSGQLNDLRLQVERLDYDNKESMITIDILKEQVGELQAQNTKLVAQLGKLGGSAADALVANGVDGEKSSQTSSSPSK